MRRTMLALGLTGLSVFCAAQTIPCENGMAGEYPCNGYDLVSHLDIVQLSGISQEANDIWGWTDPNTGKEYALIGLQNRTVFVDLCDPENPEVVGWLATHTGPSIWRDIKVYQNHAFIVSEAGGHGLQVFDLSQLGATVNRPFEFSETAHNNSFGNAHNIAINEETGYAYPIGAGPYAGGPIFINIQDPSNPINEGGYDGDGYTHDAQIVIYNGPDTEHQGKEICFASNEDTMTIIDVSQKDDPEMLSRTGYPTPGYSHQGWLSEDQRYFFLNDETDETGGLVSNTRTLVFDCQDLENPQLIMQYEGVSTSTDHNMYTLNGLLYQANYNSGMRVIDVSNIASQQMEEIGYFDVHPSDDNPGFNGSWSVYPYFESGMIIVSSIERGLFVLKKSDEVVPTSTCLASSITEEQDLRIGLFPIPAQNVLQIQSEQAGLFEIIDIEGRMILQKSILAAGTSQLDLSNVSKGFYFARFTSGTNTTSQKILID